MILSTEPKACTVLNSIPRPYIYSFFHLVITINCVVELIHTDNLAEFFAQGIEVSEFNLQHRERNKRERGKKKTSLSSEPGTLQLTVPKLDSAIH